ncbi:hypothetical protein FVE85_4757 [Porphyridium purpureum]|uniref:Uncharacterized protein n=1 Tax=Porphyridium purpureum TaxID=35688 RepID=A0A5J4YRU8_PORPP|nr:hypothetical protein FVE85_4757 [Porphyridium purpureum]|eukprot:POR4361..scf236_6
MVPAGAQGGRSFELLLCTAAGKPALHVRLESAGCGKHVQVLSDSPLSNGRCGGVLSLERWMRVRVHELSAACVSYAGTHTPDFIRCADHGVISVQADKQMDAFHGESSAQPCVYVVLAAQADREQLEREAAIFIKQGAQQLLEIFYALCSRRLRTALQANASLDLRQVLTQQVGLFWTHAASAPISSAGVIVACMRTIWSTWILGNGRLDAARRHVLYYEPSRTVDHLLHAYLLFVDDSLGIEHALLLDENGDILYGQGSRDHRASLSLKDVLFVQLIVRSCSHCLDSDLAQWRSCMIPLHLPGTDFDARKGLFLFRVPHPGPTGSKRQALLVLISDSSLKVRAFEGHVDKRWTALVKDHPRASADSPSGLQAFVQRFKLADARLCTQLDQFEIIYLGVVTRNEKGMFMVTSSDAWQARELSGFFLAHNSSAHGAQFLLGDESQPILLLRTTLDGGQCIVAGARRKSESPDSSQKIPFAFSKDGFGSQKQWAPTSQSDNTEKWVQLALSYFETTLAPQMEKQLADLAQAYQGVSVPRAGLSRSCLKLFHGQG